MSNKSNEKKCGNVISENDYFCNSKLLTDFEKEVLNLTPLYIIMEYNNRYIGS